jgi:hypothetical protein
MEHKRMTKKNLAVEMTIRVLGKELTRAEAEELHLALGNALGKQMYYPFHYVPRQPYYHSTPVWNATNLIGGEMTTTGGSDPYRVNCASSPMVETIVN